jgi:hypothetical protein
MLNQKGIATIEMIPILLLFIVLVNFTLGFFGVVHSGILNSIAARNYAFETFRNRPNLNYLRDEPSGPNPVFYSISGYRYHSITGEGPNPNTLWLSTARPIKFSEVTQGVDSQNNTTDHNITIRKMNSGTEADATSQYFPGATRATGGEVGVDPVWVMTTYGICLNANCGGT